MKEYTAPRFLSRGPVPLKAHPTRATPCPPPPAPAVPARLHRAHRPPLGDLDKALIGGLASSFAPPNSHSVRRAGFWE